MRSDMHYLRCRSALRGLCGLVRITPASPHSSLEQAQRLRAVADQQVLGLLVMVEHHLVRLPTEAGLLVAPERGMGGIQVVAVGPHPASLDLAAQEIGR